MPLSTAAPPSKQPLIAIGADADVRVFGRDWRLHKHADYQRVYQTGRKQFATLMTYFAAGQPAAYAGRGARVGITAGKVLGKAVERNRIKRRMRAAIVDNLDVLGGAIDVVLHPKRSVLTVDPVSLKNEVRRVFLKIEERCVKVQTTPPEPCA